jgi:acyl carrier protein
MVTRIDAAQLDVRLPLPSLGFDSILTAEIRGQIRTQFGVEIPLAGMLLGANLARVSELVLAALDPMPAGSDAVPATAGAAVEAGRPEATLYVN